MGPALAVGPAHHPPCKINRMVRWQKPARIGVALFGAVVAVVVYAAMGEREKAAPIERPSRFDPRAILESAGAAFQQFQQARKDYVVECERQLTYEGGATRCISVTIKVRNRGGRDFEVSGREAQASDNNKQLEVTGDVVLKASDGLTVHAGSATFSEDDAIVRIPGPVEFEKGRLSGGGVGMTYNQMTDVLSLAEQARVRLVNEAGEPVHEFESGMATLSRQENYLALDGSMRALRGDQVLEADNGIARLTDDDERITFIELRGNARVAGGGVFDSMSARDINLDYTDDGSTLERVTLSGSAGIVMTGEEGAPGRQFIGETLDLTFAPDSTLTSVVARGDVRVDLPAGAGVPARTVRAQTFDGKGEAGKGLTSGRFSDNVEYREEGGSASEKIARSTALQIALANDAVTAAAFTGRVRFEDGQLQASGGQAQYDPVAGTLVVSGVESGVSPRVANEQIQIEADSVTVTLAGPRMLASGNVKTILRPRRGGAAEQADRLPGLLQQGSAVNANAITLDYQGAAGRAVYTGNATLWQGETAIRADALTLDRRTGVLLAAGAARSNLVFDTGVSVGRSVEIRYDDRARRISYGPRVPTGAPGAAPIAPSQVSGPQGDLRAARIEVALAGNESRVERLEAYTDVNVRLDTRVATGDRLTYHADDERYVMTGIPTVPVKIVETCRETVGRTVTFFKTADRIIVDGNEEVRTQSSRGATCTQPAAR